MGLLFAILAFALFILFIAYAGGSIVAFYIFFVLMIAWSIGFPYYCISRIKQLKKEVSDSNEKINKLTSKVNEIERKLTEKKIIDKE